MKILFFMIIGYLLGEFFQLTCWEWVKKKLRLKDHQVRTILVFVILGLVITVIWSGFYTVSSNENVILTNIIGNKIVKDSYGLKYSLLSSREIISVQNQIMRYPDSILEQGYELITTDEKPLLVNAFLEYRINDVYKWGISNKDTDNKLLIAFGSKVKNIIQKSNYEYIRNNLNSLEIEIQNQLLEIETIYGVKVLNVNLQISDHDDVKGAKTNAESLKINSESLKESYLSESEALRTKYNSLEDKEFIKYMEFIRAVKEGDIDVLVIPENMNSNFNVLGGLK